MNFLSKKNFIILLGLGLLIQPLTGLAVSQDDFEGQLPNAVLLEEGLVGGGVPTEQALELAAEKGYKTVIDVRTPEEGTAAEKALAEKHGLHYVNIPTSTETMSRAQADQLNTVLSSVDAKPAILHCMTGNRAAGVWAAYRKFSRGADSDQILAEASGKGLNKPALKEKLTELFAGAQEPPSR